MGCPLRRTIGAWLVSLLEENNYFGTILPRIPKKIEDGIKVKVSGASCAWGDTERWGLGWERVSLLGGDHVQHVIVCWGAVVAVRCTDKSGCSSVLLAAPVVTQEGAR
jgi:hypothetical protein